MCVRRRWRGCCRKAGRKPFEREVSMSFGVRVVYLDKIHWHVSCVTDVRTGQRERPTDTGLGGGL